jgi:hypothetical protein
MAVKIIANLLFIIGLGTLQLAFISGLPGWLSSLNLVLVVLIFILGFADFNFAIWWSLGAGPMLELYSFLPYGAYLVSLCLTIIIANFLLNYFFTNRSLYSFLALAALATFAYELIINFISLIIIPVSIYFFWASLNFWVYLLEQLCLNLLFTLIIYYLVHYLGSNLRPVFLIKK